jgi:hypothetical protein
MRVSCLAAMVSALIVSMVDPAAGQSGKSTPPRTPDGKPDIQGTFTFSTITPLQRPQALAGKDVLTAEEKAAFEASENKRLNRDLFDPEKGAPSAGYAPRSQGGVLSYNEFWYERGSQMTDDRRTSLIVDPPDGRIPLTAAARARMAERTATSNSGAVDSYEELSLTDRCILGFNSGPPMISSTYNNNLQIVQTPDHVLIFNEMIHNARIIPTDGRPHGTLPQWTGDSRGRWEGDTLVVDTIGVKESVLGYKDMPHSDQMRIHERIGLVSADVLHDEITVEDPVVLEKPVTFTYAYKRIPGYQLLEYVCENNRDYVDDKGVTRMRLQAK